MRSRINSIKIREDFGTAGAVAIPGGGLLPLYAGHEPFESLGSAFGILVRHLTYLHDWLMRFFKEHPDKKSPGAEELKDLYNVLVERFGWIELQRLNSHAFAAKPKKLDERSLRLIVSAIEDAIEDGLLNPLKDVIVLRPKTPFADEEWAFFVKDLARVTSITSLQKLREAYMDHAVNVAADQVVKAKAESIVEMSYMKLFRMSEPKRKGRARTVRTQPPKVAVWPDKKEGAKFNFRAYPSTEDKRHKGYIKFLHPKKNKPREEWDIEASCDCRDFLYRWEVANHKVGAAKIIFSNGEDPVKTNPSERPGLCKHLLALGGYVGGMRFRESMDDIDRAVFAQRLEEALTPAL